MLLITGARVIFILRLVKLFKKGYTGTSVNGTACCVAITSPFPHMAAIKLFHNTCKALVNGCGAVFIFGCILASNQGDINNPSPAGFSNYRRLLHTMP